MSPAELPERNQIPAELDQATLAALGKLNEALETVERARGQLYGFHQLTGYADEQLAEAVRQLREAGHGTQAELLDRQIVGRNVLPGRWTFQVVEEYDDGYYEPFRAAERRVREDLAQGRRHLFEAHTKRMERTERHPAHRLAPEQPEEER